MDNKKNDIYYIGRVLIDLEFMIKHTKGMTKEQFSRDLVLLDSVMFRFIQISEHIKKLSLEFKVIHKNIPWISIIGLRNRIVHEYDNVDLDIVYDTVSKDIYDIYSLFESLKEK